MSALAIAPHCPTIEDYWQRMTNGRPPTVSLNLAELLLNHPGGMDRTAVVSPDGTFTYAELLHETRLTASALVQRGIRPNEHVAVALNDDPMQLCLVLGCWAMGAVPVLLNPQLPIDTLTYILQDLQPSLCVIREDRLDDTLHAVSSIGSHLELLTIPSGAFGNESLDWRLHHSDTNAVPFYTTSPERLQYIQYSSGTTGLPKGVMYSAHCLLAAANEMMAKFLGITADDTLYTVARAFFAYGLIHNLCMPLCLNATTVRDARWPKPEHMLANILRYRPNVLLGVPLHFQSLLEHANDFSDYTPRLTISGGAPIPSTLRRRWHDTFGTVLHDGLGSSESPDVIITTYPSKLDGCAGSGHPPPYCTLKLMDEQGKPVPTGMPGEVWVHNASLAVGYWRRPDLTAKRFHVDADGRRWYATGDIFVKDEQGNLYFKGRTDDCFKIKGRWVSPLEIEETVLKQVPEITGCLLVEGRTASGLLGTVLFMETNEYVPVDACEAAVRRALARLEHYKHPTCCCALPQLPVNANGKPDRSCLRQQAPEVLAHHDRP